MKGKISREIRNRIGHGAHCKQGHLTLEEMHLGIPKV